ncbi:hypothetical protein H0X32_02840 [Patescibacteria group bacterium]|nr:hypothetical protein [Patescibacteria group bacterium]
MNLLAFAAATLAVVVYIPTTIQVWRGKMQLNAASFLLWGLLDFIVAASIFVKGGNWLLPAAYVFGCSLVGVAILKSRTFKWTRLETVTSSLVLISIFVWWRSGPVMDTIISTAAVITAGLLQVWDIWRKPRESTLWLWVAYSIVNGLSTIAGKDWSISERFYPASCTVLTVVMVLLTLRKFGRVPIQG